MRKKSATSIRNKTLLLFLPIPVIALSFIIYIGISNLTIFPSDKNHLEFSTYDDRVENNGKSTVDNYKSASDSLSVNFTLRKGYAYPFAGCQLRVDSVYHLLNLKPYRWMILEFAPSSTISNVHIILKENIRNFTTADPLSERFHTYDLVLRPGQTKYKIATNKFNCPFWWYVQNSKSSKDFPEPDKGRIAGVNFESGSMLELDKPYNITLTKIRFLMFPLLPLIIICISFLYYSVFAAISFFRKRQSIVNQAQFHHDHLNIPNQSTENLNAVVKYIGTNYMDMNLSIQTVSEATGLSSDKITKAIKEHSDMTFRQYLNNIRISEARRLLLETDRQILDIALVVGYNSVNHFNKVFKLQMNCTPKEFRK